MSQCLIFEEIEEQLDITTYAIFRVKILECTKEYYSYMIEIMKEIAKNSELFNKINDESICKKLCKMIVDTTNYENSIIVLCKLYEIYKKIVLSNIEIIEWLKIMIINKQVANQAASIIVNLIKDGYEMKEDFHPYIKLYSNMDTTDKQLIDSLNF